MESNSRAPTFEMNEKKTKSPSEKVSVYLVFEILQRAEILQNIIYLDTVSI